MILAILILNALAILYLISRFRHGVVSHLKTTTSGSPEPGVSQTRAFNNGGHSGQMIRPQKPTELMHAETEELDTLEKLHPKVGPCVPTRIIVAMTGATGSILGVHLLKTLQRMNIETHLVISKWAAATLVYETDYTIKDLKALATKTYSASDVAAPISSGSFKTLGMIIVPSSMKTLSAVATGFGEDLVTRAADVVLKERRKLVVVARETPLNAIHLRNMMTITESGGIIFPPVPAFYTKPQSVDDIVSQSVGRMLDMFDLEADNFERWTGMH